MRTDYTNKRADELKEMGACVGSSQIDLGYSFGVLAVTRKLQGSAQAAG